jgi:hypothetical protein
VKPQRWCVRRGPPVRGSSSKVEVPSGSRRSVASREQLLQEQGEPRSGQEPLGLWRLETSSAPASVGCCAQSCAQRDDDDRMIPRFFPAARILGTTAHVRKLPTPAPGNPQPDDSRPCSLGSYMCTRTSTTIGPSSAVKSVGVLTLRLCSWSRS